MDENTTLIEIGPVEESPIEKSILEMTPEELTAWLATRTEEDERMYPFACFNLTTNEGRCGFLEEYIRFGEIRLFEAVSYLWDCLCEPRNLRCIGIGIHAGTGGSGKWALAKFLRRALRESLDYQGPSPFGKPYGSVDEFHEAAKAYFNADYQHYLRTVQKYADLLVKGSIQECPAPAKLIYGPWTVAVDAHGSCGASESEEPLLG